MSGEVAIVTATILIDNIYKHTYLWVVSRTPSRYKRLHHNIVETASQEHT